MQITDDSRKQILVVEDEGLIAADIQRKLERLGYPAPAIASSGEEALRRARSKPFDLVLMDIRLKGPLDGIATAQALKAEQDTPIVYMTAHADDETIGRAKVTEPLGYILKPVTDGDLRSVVEISLYKHEMEKRLRTSEAWLSTTLRSVGDGIIATNTSGEIVSMNPVAEKLTGWSGSDAFGCQLMDVLHMTQESDGSPAKNPIFDLLPGESRTYCLTGKTGARTIVEIECFENRTEDDVLGAIVIMRDIGTRREMESRLVQAQRMDAVTSMSGGLAHEFNNQLMIIMGYADELSGRVSREDAELLGEIRQAAAAATSITEQLLTVSHRDAVRFEVLNIRDMIAEAHPFIVRGLGRGRHVAVDIGSPAGFIRADRKQIKQVLINLALHSLEEMPADGEVRIESSIADIEPGSPAARVYRPGPYVRLVIADCGVAIDKAKIGRIFEPFFTTRKAGMGNGLSLSIAHSIVVKSGGYISASSEDGRRTSFEILLPRVGIAPGPSDEFEPEESVESEAPTILLVEDEDSVRRLMHRYLEEEGYALLEAANGKAAQEIADSYQRPIHVLVTDVVMPGVTGPELAQKLAPRRPDMKVLFVSGYRHDTLEHQGLLRHEVNLLAKPFPGPELVRRVRVLLGRGARLAH